MSLFARKRSSGSGSRRTRRPVVIGFEQLEGREMMSAGLSVTIIPNPSRPMADMPRPCVGSFNPEAPAAPRVSMTPRAVDDERIPPWPLWGRLRWRGLDCG